MKTKDEASLRERFIREMVEGYFDGCESDNPDPSANRSASYRHGFANGRDDLALGPRAAAPVLRLMAEDAIRDDLDRAISCEPRA